MAVKSAGRTARSNVVQLSRPTLRETLGRLAPGTALRDGLERQMTVVPRELGTS